MKSRSSSQICVLVASLLVVAVLPLNTARASSPIFNRIDYEVGPNPWSIAIGDLNGDGYPDLAVVIEANGAGNTVSVLLGNGDGTFQSAVSYGVGSIPMAVAIGDLNGDGHPDLAVTNFGDDTVSVLLGNGDGTFQTAVNYGVGIYPVSLAVGELNGDGHLDLAVVNKNSNNVSVLLGNGDGTFQSAVSCGVGSDPVFVAIGDLNGDGHPDLAQVPQTGGQNFAISDSYRFFQSLCSSSISVQVLFGFMGSEGISRRV